MESESNFFTNAEVLDRLKCSKTALRNLIKYDGFPTPLKFSFSGREPSRTTTARYPKAEVEAWIRDKELEARQGRQAYMPVYPAVQLCEFADIDSAIYHLRMFLDVYHARKRIIGTVRSHQSCVAPAGLRWGEMKAGIMEMLPPILSAASALGIDVEGLVKS